MDRLLRFLIWTEHHRILTLGLFCLGCALIMAYVLAVSVSSTFGWVFFILVFVTLLSAARLSERSR